MSASSSHFPSPQILRENHISRLGLFLKRNLPYSNTPENKTKYEVSKIFQEISAHPFSKKYLGKHFSFTQDFVFSIARIHNYMLAFRKSVPFENFFHTGQFPLFLLKEHSNQKQKEMYEQLVDTKKIQKCIHDQGFSGAKRMLSDLLITYEKSFSPKQLFRIHQILDLGASFQAFLQYDLTNLLLTLYPTYLQDSTLSLLPKEYSPVSSSGVSKELKSFFFYLSYLQENAPYCLFLECYGRFLDKKIISRTEFEEFFSQIREFLRDDVLLNVLRVQAQDELFFIPPSPLPRRVDRFSSIVEFVAKESDKKQIDSRFSYAHQVEEALLVYLFDKLTIVRIQEQQKSIDVFFKKPPREKSFTSLCVVLTAFGTKIYTPNIIPNLQFLLKHAVFLLSEFREDLLYYSQSMSKTLKKCNDIFEKIQDIMSASSGNTRNAIEIEARGTCQDFIAGTRELLELLSTIIRVGQEELVSKTQFVIPRDTMEKLLSNLQVSRSLIEKMDGYIQTFIQVIAVF